MQKVDTNKLFWRIIEVLQRPSDIVFLDECGFDNFQTLSTGWAPRESGPIDIKKPHKSGNITLILAVSFHYGVICY